ncbi:unnamed protein product, partial [Brenthis ino]
MNSVLALLVLLVIEVNGLDAEEKDAIEARGKGKYVLLTHLAIVAAAKIGLMNIFLGIAFAISAIKAMVVMAWALAISKYAPEIFPKHHVGHNIHSPSNHFMDALISTFNRHFFYVAATKLFILKIVYGFIFFAIIKKAWYLVLWLIQYLKEKQHDYIEIDHHPYHDYGSYGSYGSYSHEAYSAYEKPSFGYKPIYDADGSYSVGRT